MQSEIYEMNFDGKGMVKVDRTKHNNLPNGTVVMWGGNMAWGPEEFVVVEKLESEFGVSYNMVSLKDQHYHRTEAYSIKGPEDKTWHSQHMFLQEKFLEGEELERLKQTALNQKAKENAAQERLSREREKNVAKGKELFEKYVPKDAKGLIVAKKVQDESDVQTDYFGSSQTDLVVLGWSKHDKDLFSEMKKFADVIPETAHLKEGKKFGVHVCVKETFQSNGRYYGEGSRSHWHRDVEEDEKGHKLFFKTKEEAESYCMDNPLGAVQFDETLVHFYWDVEEKSFEHREKYSMGNGYYLKDGFRDNTGWEVRKWGCSRNSDDVFESLGKRCVLQ